MATNNNNPPTYRTPGEDKDTERLHNAPPPERTNQDHPLGYGGVSNTAAVADVKAADATAGNRGASPVVRESTRATTGNGGPGESTKQ